MLHYAGIDPVKGSIYNNTGHGCHVTDISVNVPSRSMQQNYTWHNSSFSRWMVLECLEETNLISGLKSLSISVCVKISNSPN